MKVKGAFSGPLRSWQSLGTFFVESQLAHFLEAERSEFWPLVFPEVTSQHHCRRLAPMGSRLHSGHSGKQADTGGRSEMVHI